jgi:hypothetical protein
VGNGDGFTFIDIDVNLFCSFFSPSFSSVLSFSLNCNISHEQIWPIIFFPDFSLEVSALWFGSSQLLVFFRASSLLRLSCRFEIEMQFCELKGWAISQVMHFIRRLTKQFPGATTIERASICCSQDVRPGV